VTSNKKEMLPNVGAAPEMKAGRPEAAHRLAPICATCGHI